MRSVATITRVAVAVLLLVFSAGCVAVFTNPLSNPQDSKLDQRLIGRWQSKEEANKSAYIQFDAASKVQLNVSLSGKEASERNLGFTAFTTKLGARTYLNLNPTDEDRDKGYLIARYDISGN